MAIKISVLVENKAAPPQSLGPAGGRVGGEHGLSLLIESDGTRILFDTGAGSLIARNADALGLGDLLHDLDAIVLSHAHYDHTGGLAEVLRRSRKKIPVHVRPGFFRRRVRRKGNDLKSIGVPESKSELEGLGARFIEEPEAREIRPDFIVSGKITRQEQWEDMDPKLCIETGNAEIISDPFEEEQALAIRSGKNLVIFVGCAHRGLLNSINAMKEAARASRVRALFGGAHLRDATDERIRRTADAVARLDPEAVVLGHCTGEKAEAYFSEVFGKRFSPLRAGASWTLD